MLGNSLRFITGLIFIFLLCREKLQLLGNDHEVWSGTLQESVGRWEFSLISIRSLKETSSWPFFQQTFLNISRSSVQFSCSVVSDSLQPHGLPHARLPCPSPAPLACSNLCPLGWWYHQTISSSPSPPAFNLSQHQGLFQWVSSSQQVAKVLEFQLQHQSFQWIFRTDLL